MAKGLLRIHSSRPTSAGLETHLAIMHKMIKDFKPKAVVIDPINNLVTVGNTADVRSMLTRLIDFLKMSGITTFFTSLSDEKSLEQTDVGLSSIMDTWILLRDIELGGERNRGLYVLKSRGMAHSNQIREFRISSKGIDLIDVYLGPEGVLTGSARAAQEERAKDAARSREQETTLERLKAERRQAALRNKIAELELELKTEETQTERLRKNEQKDSAAFEGQRQRMAKLRQSDAPTNGVREKNGARS
jgi:circadian clock protein KaiC